MDKARFEAVVEIVTDVSDLIGQINRLGFQRRLDETLDQLIGHIRLAQSFAYFPSQVEAVEFGIFEFKLFYNTQALDVVAEAALLRHQFMKRFFTQMTKRGMAEIVGQGNRLSQIFVQSQRPGEGACDAGNLDGMGHPSPVMVAAAVEENLGFVLETAKGAAMNNAVAVPLEDGTELVLILVMLAIAGEGAALRIRGKMARLILFEIGTGTRHDFKLSPYAS